MEELMIDKINGNLGLVKFAQVRGKFKG